MMAEGFGASCVQCGAPQRVVLGRAVSACRSCGRDAPLGAEGMRALDAANRQFYRLAAKDHRRRLAHRAGVEELALLAPLVFVPCWLLFGGVAVAGALSTVPDETVWGLLTTKRSATTYDDAVAAAWLCWFAATGAALTLSTYFVALAWARGGATAQHALPPLEGGPARCHMCGAGLPDGGALRVCRSCGTANLTGGRKLEHAAETLMEQLDSLSTQERHAMDRVSRELPNFVLYCALFPLLLLVAFPAAGFLHETRPDLAWVPLALAGPGVLAALLLFFQSPPKARQLIEAQPGEMVRVKGIAFSVWGRYVETSQVSLAVLLAPEGESEPKLALSFYELDGQEETKATVFEPGGEPLGPEQAAGIPLRIRTSAGEWRGSIVEGAERRIFAEGAARGALPRWTLRSENLSKLDVFVV